MLTSPRRPIGTLLGTLVVFLGLTAFASNQPGGATSMEHVVDPGAPNDLLADAFLGLAFGDSVDGARTKLHGECGSLRVVKIEKPYLPLSLKSQTHLIATEVYLAGCRNSP